VKCESGAGGAGPVRGEGRRVEKGEHGKKDSIKKPVNGALDWGRVKRKKRKDRGRMYKKAKG